MGGGGQGCPCRSLSCLERRPSSPPPHPPQAVSELSPGRPEAVGPKVLCRHSLSGRMGTEPPRAAALGPARNLPPGET